MDSVLSDSVSGPPRRPAVMRQRSDSRGRALSPADSVTSLGSTRGPLFSWMFHHIRRDNQDSLTKEDLRKLLGVKINNEQLDEAFENLDMDGDGRVSMEEFLGGFARFLLEAPVTPAARDRLSASGGGGGGGGGGGSGGGTRSRVGTGGMKRGSVRRRLVEEECYESAAMNGGGGGGGGEGQNSGPLATPSETFAESLTTLSSHNRHSMVTLWRSLADTNPELLTDFEEFVGEVAEEVEHAQRALNNQRRATKQEAMELDQEMESRLNAANTNLQIQTALTEVKTKLKLEQRLGDKENELSAVKQKLHELESEVQAGHKAHTQLEEQYEVLSQEKADLQTKLEAREAVLQEKHEEMERLHQHTSETDIVHHPDPIQETEVELQEIKREYEREITELKEKIKVYEITHSVTSDDDEMSFVSTDLLSARHRHTSRHSLLEEIANKEGFESPILRGEPQLTGHSEPETRRPVRANSLPDLFRTRQYLEPISASPRHHLSPHLSPHHHHHHRLSHHEELAPSFTSPQYNESLEDGGEYLPPPPPPPEPTTQERGEDTMEGDHMTQTTSHLTNDGLSSVPIATMDPPFSRARSKTVSGGGRPKHLPRSRGKKSATVGSHHALVMSHDSHKTSNTDTTSTSSSSLDRKEAEKEEEEEEEDEEANKQRDDQYIMKCQPLQFIENLATQPDYVFKILVVGNSYVGKSSFLMRLCTNAFSARYSSTIGVDFYSKALKVDDRIISLQLWDTAGQERFQSVTKAYYRGAQGVILMYDISQEESFIAVKSWINSIQENVDQMPTGLMLIGNKQDLDDVNEREVSTETGETFAKIYNAQFMETSAKTGFNVGNCLMNLVRTIKIYYEQDSTERRERGIQINNKPKGSGCCGR